MKPLLRSITLGVFVAAALAAFPNLSPAQSGRGAMHGYVAFDGVAYVNKQPVAKVELSPITDGNRGDGSYSGETSEHGHFEVPVPMGEYELTITAPGYAPYKTTLYVPSDFIGNLAVKLKKTETKPPDRARN